MPEKRITGAVVRHLNCRLCLVESLTKFLGSLQQGRQFILIKGKFFIGKCFLHDVFIKQHTGE